MILCVWRTFSVIFYLTVTCASEASTIFDKLKYFETLKVTDLSHFITKRGTQPSKHKFSTIKEVSFKAHGRDFRLILNPSKGLLSAHFKAYTVDGSGNKRPVWVDQNQFFEGRVFGELDSNVSAHMDDGVMTASIRVKNDIYVVEPSWRHIPQDSNATMIVYRASDVKYSWDPTHGAESLTKYCGYVKEGANSSLESAGDAAENSGHWEGHGKGGGGSSHVEKRQAMEPYHWEPVQTRCSLLLVADHRFYENMGGRNLKSTINFLITLIDRVNKIFLDTEWRDSDRHPGFRGMGFVIQEVMVHTEPTPVLRNEVHYNMAGVTWNVRDLLEVFSRSLNHRWFCLAHLFTDQKFEGGILGLAYVGSPRRNSVGGICSPGYVKNGYTLYLNSGLSTSRNHYGQRVITREADLVTAHGHNWGSEHDPDLPECSPDSPRGGSYLMYTYSVSGYDPNNKKFSPCSVRSIRAVLLAKASKCFSKPEESFCGNSLVEEGEQCDAGLIGSEDSDPCCDDECRLKQNAKCSDRNSPCCRNCDYSQYGALCREAQPNACKNESHCTGKSAECPPSRPLDDDKPCLDKGKCRGGECMPYCETRGEISCMCDTEVDACKRCCRPSHNATCKPTEPMEILRDGTPCIHGYCEKGRCEKTVQDIVERFWDIIEDIDINTVLKFLNDNIVGTVIVVSIIVWVPGSCLISYVDHRRRAEYEKSKKTCRKRDSLQPFRLPSDSSVKVVHISRRQPQQHQPQPQQQHQPQQHLPQQHQPQQHQPQQHLPQQHLPQQHQLHQPQHQPQQHPVASSQEQGLGPALRMSARAAPSSHNGDYWSTSGAYAAPDRSLHGPRYEGRPYVRPSSVAEGGSYGRHDPSDYYHHHPSHPQGYGRPGTGSVSERPGSRSRQHIENYTVL
ncbi:ADAM 17-like protease isoform X4 [Ixodes scapularis]|uniref:ADAM 17-like protease isoform X4 n=1 Tax=Ixodes scapularis TaxID=6945 RepID=UPI001AD727DB|nr:ADAM 17-like protease isoform X4 [Ixodes scapularis]